MKSLPRTILSSCLIGCIGLAYGQQAMPEPSFIEFLGEFDEENVWLLEESMAEVELKEPHADEQDVPKEVNDDKTTY